MEVSISRIRNAALLTGASAGLGKELAKFFAAGGDDVVLVERTAYRLDELADYPGNTRDVRGAEADGRIADIQHACFAAAADKGRTLYQFHGGSRWRGAECGSATTSW
ncbi:SDR family NAD(P)-dependent oxidoreductase [Mycolicibacterium sp. CBMA 234]|uniref:SDR family NAD(P)-dependent oxidoreductase n=1 Tax=Mycolicibacterium sp. CBMA 234 TaxID=1918495 RepID=UPI0012DC5874|nr:SDR family NAD(P)-dependent oxidoreductase [Mycolicibacterium sp. CBMA 234]